MSDLSGLAGRFSSSMSRRCRSRSRSPRKGRAGAGSDQHRPLRHAGRSGARLCQGQLAEHDAVRGRKQPERSVRAGHGDHVIGHRRRCERERRQRRLPEHAAGPRFKGDGDGEPAVESFERPYGRRPSNAIGPPSGPEVGLAGVPGAGAAGVIWACHSWVRVARSHARNPSLPATTTSPSERTVELLRSRPSWSRMCTWSAQTITPPSSVSSTSESVPGSVPVCAAAQSPAKSLVRIEYAQRTTAAMRPPVPPRGPGPGRRLAAGSALLVRLVTGDAGAPARRRSRRALRSLLHPERRWLRAVHL